MPIVKETEWNEWVKNKQDPYGKCCVDVARKVMEILDEEQEFDCHEVINRAVEEIKAGGITGFMAGYVAQMVSFCHSRGEEFRVKWNEGYNVDESAEGVVNPRHLGR